MMNNTYKADREVIIILSGFYAFKRVTLIPKLRTLIAQGAEPLVNVKMENV